MATLLTMPVKTPDDSSLLTGQNNVAVPQIVVGGTVGNSETELLKEPRYVLEGDDLVLFCRPYNKYTATVTQMYSRALRGWVTIDPWRMWPQTIIIGVVKNQLVKSATNVAAYCDVFYGRNFDGRGLMYAFKKTAPSIGQVWLNWFF